MLNRIQHTTRRVISLEITQINYSDALSQIIFLAKNNVPSYVCFANVHMVVEAHWDATFAKQVNDATLALADGAPVAKASGLLYQYKQDRIAGMDVMPDILKLADANHLKVFFF